MKFTNPRTPQRQIFQIKNKNPFVLGSQNLYLPMFSFRIHHRLSLIPRFSLHISQPPPPRPYHWQPQRRPVADVSIRREETRTWVRHPGGIVSQTGEVRFRQIDSNREGENPNQNTDFHPPPPPLQDRRNQRTRQLEMAEAAPAVSAEELLEWSKKDKKRFLHVVYRVGDLERTIKFYTEALGMKLLRQRDVPEEKYSNAFLGFGPETSNFAVELTYNYGVDKYDLGTGFAHFAIAATDVYKLVETIRSKGGEVTREPSPEKSGTILAFIKDPDGYRFELLQRPPTPEPLCQVMLRVGDLERSIKFYEKALGMKLLTKYDVPEGKFSIAMLGYGDLLKTTVLGLTYNYGVTEYTKGNAYAQLAIGTNDVYKSAEVVKLAIQEHGGKITREAGPLPGLNTKIAGFLDPDGWKTVLVDNEDFLKELE